MNGSLVAMIVGEMAFVGFLLWLGAGLLKERSRRRTELQLRVMDRFASAPEFLAFLDTETGRHFRDALSGRPFHAVRQILGGVHLGVVLIALGGGLYVASRSVGDRDLLVAATVCAAVGLGLLIAAALSKRLARRWGVWTDRSTTSESR